MCENGRDELLINSVYVLTLCAVESTDSHSAARMLDGDIKVHNELAKKRKEIK